MDIGDGAHGFLPIPRLEEHGPSPLIEFVQGLTTDVTSFIVKKSSNRS